MTFNKWLQTRLTAHGYPVGVIDGIIGPITTAALKRFDQAHNLPGDGRADKYMVNALRAPAAIASPGEMAVIPDRDKQRTVLSVGGRSGVWPRQKDVRKFYGKLGANQTSIEIPFDMVLAWDKNYHIKRMTLHKKVAASALKVLENVSEIYTERERHDLGLDIFSGSLNVRKMRGGSRYSMHSWGIAIDFDNQRNGLSWKKGGKPRPRLSDEDALPFWQEWEKVGWLSLGRSRDFDWMHIQAARL
jgi:hypothetical protein